ncbi:MAG: aldehyde dehydrogenase [Yangia sp.]|nr:aldehyde dehydrogenase [Salipiger sp.]
MGVQDSIQATPAMTIAGRAVNGTDRFDVFDPSTGKVLATAPNASPADLDAAIAAARDAGPAWTATPWQDRQTVLQQMAGVLVQNKDELTRLLVMEQGRPLEAALREIMISAYWFSETAKLRIDDDVISDDASGTTVVRHLPLGVVGALVPWNYPVVLAVWKIAPALLAGNTMVLKPSPFTPLTTLRMVELMREVVPAGVLNTISGDHDLGPRMTSHPGFDKISFTGSTDTGKAVMRSAANGLARLTLELGGNDAAIVLDDADLDTTVPALFWGAFINSGQICIAAKRIYVHDSIYEVFAQRFADLARSVKMGPGLEEGVQLGPVQNARQYERVCDLLQDCKSQGYTILAGGDLPGGEGWFVPATVVDNPPDDARIVREEPFGPIVPLLKFSAEDEVVARANATDFGLAGSVWTRDEARGRALARRLRTGTVWINTIQKPSPHAPLSGHKSSGFGVENGIEGLRAYTITQTIALERSA